MPVIKKYNFRNIRENKPVKKDMRENIKTEILFGPGSSGNKIALGLASLLILLAGGLFVYVNYILACAGLI
jgi:hypothetical protein